ncbi:DinB family protein [Methylomonas paludis]|uniref:DinB family protein n=2 Tax=Methylomonas paludis TaxID=1173101 RepID=A0A975MQ13_9GAMM|nr:DinB family protein [Methylomonas paludis]
MSCIEHISLMANYNSWMNAKLYSAAGQLATEELLADRGAFFGSILGTLNHIVVADTIWLKRFAAHPGQHFALEPIRQLPAPVSLDQLLCTDISSLAERRYWLDAIITTWTQSLTETDLDHILPYTNTKGIPADKVFFSLLMHFFNHQTHHRGQATTLLFQLGIDVGVTDLLALIPNQVA